MKLSDESFDALTRDVAAKLRQKRAMLDEAEGTIVIRLIRKGNGFDIKFTLTT